MGERHASTMNSNRKILTGWKIVGIITLLLLALFAVIFAVAGTAETGIRMFIRASARTSFLLFSCAFLASALYRLWPGPLTSWLRTNRRYVGVSFAVSHTFHLLGLFALSHWSAQRFITINVPGVMIGGGIAYFFILLMALTSFDRTARWLGARRWRILHLTGAYIIWAIFALDYVPLAIQKPFYIPFALLAVSIPVLRFLAWRQSRRIVQQVASAS
jgi:methionine sulfoxide reductase heme-binding subunit